MYHKMQYMVGTYKFSMWEKAKHELYPFIDGHHPSSYEP